jgi:PPOX class probable F420-dependent enzyme
MPKPPVPDHVQEFLREPHPAVMATVKPDGSPHTAVTWYDWVDGRALVSMDISRVRLRYLRNDPRVSLTVVERGNWYRAATILGRAELHDDEGLVDIDRIAQRYTGAPYVDRVRERVSAWIEPEQWYAWDATAAAPKDDAETTM